jgi:RNA polymerase sigma factor (sigma-70 family)
MNETLPHESAFQGMKVRKADPEESQAEESKTAVAGPGAFETTFLEQWGHVYRLLVRLVGDPAEAEDLALETFFRLYQKPPASEEGSNLGGWLHRVATNLGLTSIRSFKRRERYELSAGKRDILESPLENHPLEVLAREEDRRLVRLVLARMNPRQSQLLVMRYSGMGYKEMAQTLGVSPTSIGPLLLRAEREFEKRYRALTQEER